MSRRGLPADPPATPAQAVVSGPDQPGTASPRRARSGAADRAKLTVQLRSELVDELRDAVVYLPTQGVQATVAGIVEQALDHELARLREEHHRGERFPARDVQPRAGRPVGR